MRTEVTATAESLAFTAAVTLVSSVPVTGVSLFALPEASGDAAAVEVDVGVVVAALESAAPVPIRPAAATRAATPVTILLVLMLTPIARGSVSVDRCPQSCGPIYGSPVKAMAVECGYAFVRGHLLGPRFGRAISEPSAEVACVVVRRQGATAGAGLAGAGRAGVPARRGASRRAGGRTTGRCWRGRPGSRGRRGGAVKKRRLWVGGAGPPGRGGGGGG